jgi:hypothetical protein
MNLYVITIAGSGLFTQDFFKGDSLSDAFDRALDRGETVMGIDPNDVESLEINGVIHPVNGGSIMNWIYHECDEDFITVYEVTENLKVNCHVDNN